MAESPRFCDPPMRVEQRKENIHRSLLTTFLESSTTVLFDCVRHISSLLIDQAHRLFRAGQDG